MFPYKRDCKSSGLKQTVYNTRISNMRSVLKFWSMNMEFSCKIHSVQQHNIVYSRGTSGHLLYTGTTAFMSQVTINTHRSIHQCWHHSSCIYLSRRDISYIFSINDFECEICFCNWCIPSYPTSRRQNTICCKCSPREQKTGQAAASVSAKLAMTLFHVDMCRGIRLPFKLLNLSLNFKVLLGTLPCYISSLCRNCIFVLLGQTR